MQAFYTRNEEYSNDPQVLERGKLSTLQILFKPFENE